MKGENRIATISTISTKTSPETFRSFLIYLLTGRLTTFTAIATVREADLQRLLEVRRETSSSRIDKNIDCKSMPS